ncbi:hypothetical protein F5B20DRAFT_252721 [Whalleya microplaca]|nr:hypothetical protein F5B20DRAFT_252721 [Whalleya microplaca]
MDALSVNHQFLRSACNVQDVEKALVEGLDPNAQWKELDLVSPRPTGGCVVPTFTTGVSWANWNTPLHLSLEKRQYDAAAVLLKNGAQIGSRNALGRTPLHEAITRSDDKGVRFLIENGANIDCPSEERSFKDQYLDRYGSAGIVPLQEAIRAWDLQMVELLIEGGANLNQISPDGWTILDLALLERNESIMDLLHKHGARLSERVISREGMPPASLRDMAQLLLADVSMFPPSSYRGVYLHVISHPEFLYAWTEYSTSSASTCRVLLDTFLDILSQTAERPNPENVPGAPTCISCSRFLKQLSPDNSGPFELHPDRSSLGRSARDGCCLCAVFEDALVHGSGRWAYGGNPNSLQIENSPEVLLLSQFSVEMPKVTITVHCENQSETLHVLRLSDSFMIDHRQFPDDPELGTASPRAFKVARAWLENCKYYHSTCSEAKDEDPVLPTRVIDVGNETSQPFLYEGNGKRAPYLSLSYCWGHSNNFKTTKESLPDRMKAIPLSALPPTLRDAVLATRELGFRFLWIDAICIVQDDAGDWEREAAQMQAIYSNATMTMSALESEDSMGGLFRPRRNYLTNPVQISLRVPKKYKLQMAVHLTSYFVLPVHGEKELLRPGPVDSRAWTLQEQVLSTRVIHWGPGILYWECLGCHGSEADPEGDTHPYNSSCTNFTKVRQHKRLVQGRHQDDDISYYRYYESPFKDNQPLGRGDSDDESEDGDETPAEIELGQDEVSDEEQVSGDNENSDRDNEEEEDYGSEEEFDLEQETYLEWQHLVSEYCSRGLTKQADKVPGFLGLSKMIERALQDEFIAGIWKKSHFFPSLLWTAQKPGGNSRNRSYPSWTWASIDGRVKYQSPISKAIWEPSSVTFDVQTSGPSQNHATGSITLRSTLRKCPKNYKFWRYENNLCNPIQSYTFSRDDFETKTTQRIREELMVVEGFRDLAAASPEAKMSGGWEGAGNDIYCLVVARIRKQPPPKFGYPAFIHGRPRSLVCLCLTPVHHDERAEIEEQPMVFRRVGLCEFWDTQTFQKGAMKDQLVTII